MRSGHNNLVTAALTAAILLVAAPAIAQVIETVRDASTYCRYSETRYREGGESGGDQPADEPEDKPTGAEPSPAEGDEGDEGHGDEGYEKTRRQLVHRPLTVTLGAEQAPVIGYDRGTGILSINVYGEVPVVEGYGLRLPSTPTLDFELPEDRAQELVSRFQAGTARLKVVFLPPAYARYDLPLCEKHASKRAPAKAATAPPIRRVIVGELLAAHLVDEEGEPLASFQTRLGHEVEMMRNHRISGYLASALPSVTVTSLVLYGEPAPAAGPGEPRVDPELHDQLGTELQKVLFGCYVHGLRRNARLQGALVVQFVVGQSPEPRVLVDSIHHREVVTCTLKRVGHVADAFSPRVEQPASMKATLIFKLQSPRD